MTPEIAEHLEYLIRVSTGPEPPITAETAELARRAWQDIYEASGFKMPVPAACTGPDGIMFYSWDRGRHHLVLEIIPGHAAEWFYTDQETAGYWSGDYMVGEPFSPWVVEKLKLFTGESFSKEHT